MSSINGGEFFKLIRCCWHSLTTLSISFQVFSIVRRSMTNLGGAADSSRLNRADKLICDARAAPADGAAILDAPTLPLGAVAAVGALAGVASKETPGVDDSAGGSGRPLEDASTQPADRPGTTNPADHGDHHGGHHVGGDGYTDSENAARRSAITNSESPLLL